jgi:hypothetical protein
MAPEHRAQAMIVHRATSVARQRLAVEIQDSPHQIWMLDIEH